jgi:hypothetical protein
MALPDGENATPYPVFGTAVAGLVNLVPKPEPLHGYAEMKGEAPAFTTAIALPDGLNATSWQSPAGSVDGSLNFVPKPLPLQG